MLEADVDAGGARADRSAAPEDGAGAEVGPACNASQPRPPKPKANTGEDFLSFVLQSFADQGRLMRLRQCFQRARSVDTRTFFAAWVELLQQSRSIEGFHEKVIRRETRELLLKWQRCARRAAIARIDFEIDSLNLESDLGDHVISESAALRQTSTHTHETRMQSLLAALRQARTAERETAKRASQQAATHQELLAEMRGQISGLQEELRQTEEKYMHAAKELKSSSDTLGSLCAMYLSKQEEVLLATCIPMFDYLRGGREQRREVIERASMDNSCHNRQVRRLQTTVRPGAANESPPKSKNPFELIAPVPGYSGMAEMSLSEIKELEGHAKKHSEVRERPRRSFAS
jgi:hypothetical protein